MKKGIYFVFAIIVIAALAYGYNIYSTNRDFELKQKCHDDAVKYLSNKKDEVKNMQTDFKDQGSPKVTYTAYNSVYNKNLNTCLIDYIVNEDAASYKASDTVHPPRSTDMELIDDVLTAKPLASWTMIDLYNTNSIKGFIGNKQINDEKEFTNEKALLMGAE